MNPEPRDPLIQLAERVAAVASELGMATAIIHPSGLGTMQPVDVGPSRCPNVSPNMESGQPAVVH